MDVVLQEPETKLFHNQSSLSHSVILIGDDFILVGAGEFGDIIGNDLGIADFNIANGVIVSCVGEEYHEC